MLLSYEIDSTPLLDVAKQAQVFLAFIKVTLQPPKPCVQ